MNNQMILTLAGALAVLLYFTVRHYLRRWQRAQAVKAVDGFLETVPLCTGNAHRWRSIVAPYSRQCRRCGVVQFREDEKGNFPDGLEEYFRYVSNLPEDARRLPPPVDMCHCGAQMFLSEDESLGEIWHCDICGSWRKTAKQDKLDSETRTYTERKNPS